MNNCYEKENCPLGTYAKDSTLTCDSKFRRNKLLF